MSEQLPPTGPAPRPPEPPAPAAPKPQDGQGSLLGGIGLAWAIMIGGSLIVGPISVSLWLVPPVAIVIIAVVFLTNGKTRTGRGMLLGLASIVAVVLLLVAACFGLLMHGGMGGF